MDIQINKLNDKVVELQESLKNMDKVLIIKNEIIELQNHLIKVLDRNTLPCWNIPDMNAVSELTQNIEQLTNSLEYDSDSEIIFI